jgi:hypothetical protein
VNAIEVSPFDKGTAYIATTRFKFNDHAPGLYKTTDYGATWTKIDKGIPNGAFTRVVREDEVRRDLLFAGTELGLYVSWNGGLEWTPFQLNLPNAPITDLKVHQGNLIAATSGRAMWILDDLALLRQYKPAAPALVAYRPAPAYLVNGGSELNSTDSDFTGADLSHGVNPANGVVLYYQLPEVKKGETVSLEIADATGRVVRTLSSAKDTTFPLGWWPTTGADAVSDQGPQPVRVGHATRHAARRARRVHRGQLPGAQGIPRHLSVDPQGR